MLKIFGTSTLAVIAAAVADGNGFDNLVTTELIPGKLLLNLYNKANGEIDELHGELAWTDTSAMPVYRSMGFCIRAKGDTEVDCMTVNFAVDQTTIEDSYVSFEINDGYATDFRKVIRPDASAETRDDDSLNWRLAGVIKSKKEGCTVVSNSTTSCELAIAHWIRHFATAETTQDI